MFLFLTECALQRNLFKTICISYTVILQSEIIANADSDRIQFCAIIQKSFWTIKHQGKLFSK